MSLDPTVRLKKVDEIPLVLTPDTLYLLKEVDPLLGDVVKAFVTTNTGGQALPLVSDSQTNIAPYSQLNITANRTLDKAIHNNKFIRVNPGAETEIVVTFPLTTGFPSSFTCEFSRVGLGAVRFAAASGVIIEAEKFRIFGKYTSVACRIVGPNTWTILGDLY